MDNGLDTKAREKIISLISALLPRAKIYLFGSRARGTYSKWSDIDIALDADVPLPITAVDEIKSVFEATNMPYKIEVVDFHRVSPSMREAIRREGILWKP
jgi:predicted nucleotidyltransferase